MMTTCSMKSVAVRKSLYSVVLNSAAVTAMANLFSLILEKKVTNLAAIHLLNAHLSFAALLLLADVSVLVAVLLLLWFALAVLQCRKDAVDNAWSDEEN